MKKKDFTPQQWMTGIAFALSLYAAAGVTTLWLRGNPDKAALSYIAGEVYFRRGDFDRAVDRYKAVVQVEPQAVYGYDALASAYMEQGDIDYALENFKKGLAIEPENANLYNGMGVAYERSGMIDKAIESYKKAVELFPDHKNAQKNLERLSSTSNRTKK